MSTFYVFLSFSLLSSYLPNNKATIKKLLLRKRLLPLQPYFRDFTLVSEDGAEFPCHRNVLAAQSSVFKKMFLNLRPAAESYIRTNRLKVKEGLAELEKLEKSLKIVSICIVQSTRDPVQVSVK